MRAECTGLSAAWCPNHGDCVCPDRGYSDGNLDDDACPLHSPESEHPWDSEAPTQTETLF